MFTPEDIESIATTIHNLTHLSKNHPSFKPESQSGLIKLPPAFTAIDNATYGDGLSNLKAMIKIFDESLTLSSVVKRYNDLGGLPILKDNDIRKVHNWLQKVSFAIRAAVIHQEYKGDTNAAEKVYNRLCLDNRDFITISPENIYELKPLKRPSKESIISWIKQEYNQQTHGATFATYGAKPTRDEWETYGLKGQLRSLRSAVSAEIYNVIEEAKTADCILYNFKVADELDNKLRKISEEIGLFQDGFEWEILK